MPRTTKTITFSLPPEMAERLDEVMQRQGRSRSEFLREAVLRYIEECEWRQLLQYGEERARAQGIGPEGRGCPGGRVPGRSGPVPNVRVVLDTNVVISALNFPGNERLVLELALRGRSDFFLSLFILEEVAAVLMHKFGWDEYRTAQAIRGIENAATVIDPPRLPEVIEGGHADNRVLDCAVAVSGDYLVTGDRRHLPPIGKHQGTRIVNAPRFLSALGR